MQHKSNKFMVACCMEEAFSSYQTHVQKLISGVQRGLYLGETSMLSNIKGSTSYHNKMLHQVIRYMPCDI